ncbi:MAG: hypothetical protein Q4C12_05180 [Clostridia bacterium]|nr:hypothetical protein [Clostridia bacterium]
MTENQIEFRKIVADILDHPEVQKLSAMSHHCDVTRLDHCVDVAYCSFIVARVFNLDYVSAARGALLHDLFFYEFKGSRIGVFWHVKLHPFIALYNAKRLFLLNQKEENIILSHMWLSSTVAPLPRSREAFIVTFADKYCATKELLGGLMRSMRRKYEKFAG